MKKEFFKINLKSINKNFFNKKDVENTMKNFSCDSKKSVPSSKNFIFKIKSFPSLTSSLIDLDWNLYDKKLIIKLNETSNFDVYNWIKHIENKNKEIESNPSNLIEPTYCEISLKDFEGNYLSNIKFINLSLNYHHCYFNSECEEQNIKHDLVIKYKYEEFKLLNENLDNQDTDTEWQQSLT